MEFLRNTLSEEGVQTLLTRLVALSSFAVLESTKNSFDSYIDQFESIEKRLSLHPKLLISYTESLFTQFMIDMIDGELRGDILTKYTNTSASRTPTAILQYVKDNYATLTLPELAAKFGYSESQIARIIKKYTGFTYSTYVMVSNSVFTKSSEVSLKTQGVNVQLTSCARNGARTASGSNTTMQIPSCAVYE